MRAVKWQFGLPASFQFDIVLTGFGHSDIKIACRSSHADGRSFQIPAIVDDKLQTADFFHQEFQRAARDMAVAWKCHVVFMGPGWPDSSM